MNRYHVTAFHPRPFALPSLQSPKTSSLRNTHSEGKVTPREPKSGSEPLRQIHRALCRKENLSLLFELAALQEFSAALNWLGGTTSLLQGLAGA